MLEQIKQWFGSVWLHKKKREKCKRTALYCTELDSVFVAQPLSYKFIYCVDDSNFRESRFFAVGKIRVWARSWASGKVRGFSASGSRFDPAKKLTNQSHNDFIPKVCTQFRFRGHSLHLFYFNRQRNGSK